MNDTEGYQVKLEQFEGPLDLLLHLINRYEIDIYDIPVAKITEQYMQYIRTMESIELNIASEYLVMAATLLAIKSQMLLPNQKLDDEEEYVEDPRKELMERLIEYRKYKEAAGQLKEIEIEDNQVFTRPAINVKETNHSIVIEKGAFSIYDMIGALNRMLERKKWNEPLQTTVNYKEVTIEERMDEIINKLIKKQSEILFDDLFVYQNKSHIVITFIAILQLMKINKIICRQKRQLDPLYISLMEETVWK